MSSGEKLDPLPDTFILQPPVFHPVSSRWDLQPPGSQGSSLPAEPCFPAAHPNPPTAPASPLHLPIGSGRPS